MNEAATPFYKKPKHQVLAAAATGQFLYLVFATIAARNVYISTALAVAFTLGYGIAILGWCRLDSRERGFALSPRFPYAVVIFGTFSLIFYLFRSRGFARGLGSVSVFFASLIALFIIDTIFAVIVLVLISFITRTPLPK